MAANILVVDDNRYIRELLSLHLTSAGYRVRLAEDAVVAGRMILESAPDLLIADVEMPHMNGFELAAALLADQTVPHIPVIFLTARTGLEQRAAMLGANLIVKPCRAGEILHMVEHCLGKQPRSAAAMLKQTAFEAPVAAASRDQNLPAR
jgi:adenylate cyclase